MVNLSPLKVFFSLISYERKVTHRMIKWGERQRKNKHLPDKAHHHHRPVISSTPSVAEVLVNLALQ
jgi:hypothetical protein